MSALEGWLAGPGGSYAAILAMTAATYACRVSGVAFMSRIRITPRIGRALRALPGSIVIATVLPIAAQTGPSAFIGLAAAVAVMSAVRFELAALVAGLAGVSLARMVGL